MEISRARNAGAIGSKSVDFPIRVSEKRLFWEGNTFVGIDSGNFISAMEPSWLWRLIHLRQFFWSKMKTILALVIFLISTGMISPLPAQERADSHTDRKGFIIGLDIGGGGLHAPGGGGLQESQLLAPLFLGFKMGGGINERVLLLGEYLLVKATGSHTKLGGDNNPSYQTFLLGCQFFVTDFFYLRPEFGYGFGKFGGAALFTKGFSGGAAGGYEFRLTRKFSLSPELKFNYLRAGGDNNYSYGAIANLKWYF